MEQKRATLLPRRGSSAANAGMERPARRPLHPSSMLFASVGTTTAAHSNAGFCGSLATTEHPTRLARERRDLPSVE
jgi:hypothetical protein